MKFKVLPYGACALLFAARLAADSEAVTPADPGVAAERFPPTIELPESEGRELVERACTKCHVLAGLEAYKGYWNRAQWQAMVDSMVKNGAELQAAEQEIVTDYLTRHFGPGTRQ